MRNISLTPEEVNAALRFHETIHDDGSYDIPREKLRALSEQGLIEHQGKGFYVETDKMIDFINATERNN